MKGTALRRVPADAWVVLACAAYFVSLVAHHRFHQADFLAYRAAAGMFVHGAPLYFVVGPESQFLYRYAPPVALAFVPFHVLPQAVASCAWYAIVTLLVVALRRLLARDGALRPAWTFVFFLAIGSTLERELGVGNINLLNLVLSLVAVRAAAAGAGGAARAGGLLAALTLVKPPNALVLLPLARRRPALVPVWVVASLALLALPLPFYGLAGTRALYTEFARSLADFGHVYGVTFKYHATTAGLLERAAFLAGLARTPDGAGALFPALGLAFALVALAAASRRGAAPELPALVALALVPLSATSDTNVYVFVAPLVWWLLRARQDARWPLAANVALVAGLALFGGNWHDLWGRRLSVALADAGVHGLGAWILVALALARPARPGPAIPDRA